MKSNSYVCKCGRSKGSNLDCYASCELKYSFNCIYVYSIHHSYYSCSFKTAQQVIRHLKKLDKLSLEEDLLAYNEYILMQ